MTLEEEIRSFMNRKGMEFLYFIDIASFHHKQNGGLTGAIVFGKALSVDFIQRIIAQPSYVSVLKQNKNFEQDEFYQTERLTDSVADQLSEWLNQKGYLAISQSEKQLEKAGRYDALQHRSVFPHKSIARLAGMGWIGKHNLLVSEEFGSAFSLCTVLTNAKLETNNRTPVENRCGNCSSCVNACPENALSGKSWTSGTDRDDLLNVGKCTTCLLCMMTCPFTRKYVNKSLKMNGTPN